MGNNDMNIKHLILKPYILFLVFITLVLSISLWYWQQVYIPIDASIIDFDTCSQANGSNIIDSDPKQCIYQHNIYYNK